MELARRGGTGIVLSPLDSYVTGRLVSQSVPAREVMGRDPLTVDPDDLLSDIADRIKDVNYSAAIVVDGGGVPVGLVTRAELVRPAPRRVLLVDHGEQAQSVPGVEESHIVEILDHHHIGSIETASPCAATFDPVGSTATLVVERFRAAGREPGGRRPRCCWRRSSPTRSSSARRRPPTATTGSSTTSRSSSSSTPGRSGRRCSRRPRTSATCPRRRSSGATSRSTRCARARPWASPRSRPSGGA